MTFTNIYIAAILLLPTLGILWVIWQTNIRPLFIPKHEIQTLTDEYIVKFGKNAHQRAHTNQDRAWRYSQYFEQAKWKKVCKAIRNKHQ